MWHTYEGHFWGMHWLWWIIWLILIVLLFVTPWNVPGKRPKDTPLDILKKRFARGEISKEEYEERKKVLLQDEEDS